MVATAKWALVPEVDMAQEPDSLAFRFAVVIALAMVISSGSDVGQSPVS